jgi:hypothetical protein
MTTTYEIPAEVLAVLLVPGLEDLDDAQRRGVACVWCKTTLDAETAVDLGERPPPDRWFPRACASCTTARATKGLHRHSEGCTPCAKSPQLCDTGLVLARLAMGRRP